MYSITVFELLVDGTRSIEQAGSTYAAIAVKAPRYYIKISKQHDKRSDTVYKNTQNDRHLASVERHHLRCICCVFVGLEADKNRQL